MRLCSYCAGQLEKGRLACPSCGKLPPETVQLSPEREADAVEDQPITWLKLPPRLDGAHLEYPLLQKIMGRVILLGVLFFLAMTVKRFLDAAVKSGSFGVGTGISETLEASSDWLVIGFLLLLLAVGYEWAFRLVLGTFSGPRRSSSSDIPLAEAVPETEKDKRQPKELSDEEKLHITKNIE